MVPQHECIATEQLGAEGASLIDRLLSNGQALTILRDGKPVARIVPLGVDEAPLRGSVLWEGDIISPIDEKWDAEQ